MKTTRQVFDGFNKLYTIQSAQRQSFSASCVSWDRLNSRRLQTRTLFIFSSRLDYCNSMSAGVSGQWSRMLLLLQPWGMSAWRQFCAVYTAGYLQDSSHHNNSCLHGGAPP